MRSADACFETTVNRLHPAANLPMRRVVPATSHSIAHPLKDAGVLYLGSKDHTARKLHRRRLRRIPNQIGQKGSHLRGLGDFT